MLCPSDDAPAVYSQILCKADPDNRGQSHTVKLAYVLLSVPATAQHVLERHPAVDFRLPVVER